MKLVKRYKVKYASVYGKPIIEDTVTRTELDALNKFKKANRIQIFSVYVVEVWI